MIQKAASSFKQFRIIWKFSKSKVIKKVITRAIAKTQPYKKFRLKTELNRRIFRCRNLTVWYCGVKKGQLVSSKKEKEKEKTKMENKYKRLFKTFS